MKSRGILCSMVNAGTLLLTPAADALAQAYPAKPLRIIVPVAAGGNVDLVARSVAQRLTATLGQQVIVENRPGASSLVGTQFVAKAPADGYTLLAIASTFVSAPSLIKNPGYDPVKDFAGISLTCWLPQILIVNPSVPVKSVKELIALAKARPNELTIAHSGNGSTGHIALELFNRQAGTRMVQIPYKGNAPSLIDVIGGQVVMMFDTISTSVQYVKTGKVRPLGVTSVKRSPLFPDVPTIAETLPGYEAAIFNGIIAPAGTPRDILAKLNAEIAKAVQQPELRERFLAQGVELGASDTPEHFSDFIRSQVARFSKLVQDVGIKPE